MTEESKLSLDDIVTIELEGKSAAISSYDEILWKIRSGYASILYGSVAVLSALVNKEVLTFGDSVTLSATVLIVGFSIFGAGMDYSFLSSKLRVVKHRDHLLRLSCDRAVTGAWSANTTDILNSLVNSGETKEKIDWEKRPGLRKLYFLNGGTCLVCVVAINILSV